MVFLPALVLFLLRLQQRQKSNTITCHNYKGIMQNPVPAFAALSDTNSTFSSVLHSKLWQFKVLVAIYKFTHQLTPTFTYCVPPPLSAGWWGVGGGWGVVPLTKFSKRWGLTGPQLLEGVAGKEAGWLFFRGEGVAIVTQRLILQCTVWFNYSALNSSYHESWIFSEEVAILFRKANNACFVAKNSIN